MARQIDIRDRLNVEISSSLLPSTSTGLDRLHSEQADFFDIVLSMAGTFQSGPQFHNLLVCYDTQPIFMLPMLELALSNNVVQQILRGSVEPSRQALCLLLNENQKLMLAHDPEIEPFVYEAAWEMIWESLQFLSEGLSADLLFCKVGAIFEKMTKAKLIHLCREYNVTEARTLVLL